MSETGRQNVNQGPGFPSSLSQQSPDQLLSSPRSYLHSSNTNKNPRYQTGTTTHHQEETSPLGQEVYEEIIRPIQRGKAQNISPGYFTYNEPTIRGHTQDIQSSHTQKKQYYSNPKDVGEVRKDASIQTLPVNSISDRVEPFPPSYATAQQLRNSAVRTPQERPTNIHPNRLLSAPSQPQDVMHTSHQQSGGSQIMDTPLLLLPSYEQHGPVRVEMVPVKTVSVPANQDHGMIQLSDPNVPFVVPSIPDHQLTAPLQDSVPVPNSHVAYEELTGYVPPEEDVHTWVDSQNRMFAQNISPHVQLQSQPDFSIPPFPGYVLPENTQTQRKGTHGRPQGTSDSGIGSNPSSRGL